MRFLNWIANHLFAAVFSFMVGFRIKDTLCGTKAISRESYRRLKAKHEDLGQMDPFGDFDLILGAAGMGLRVLDVPVHYRARRCGNVKIRRFADGFRLVKMLTSIFYREDSRYERTSGSGYL